MVKIPTGLLETGIAVIAGAIFTLIGIIYHKLRQRITQLEESLGTVEERIIELRQEVDISHTWMFGREEDPTNNGISTQIEDLDDDVDDIVDQLHDEESLDLHRNDIDE